MADVIVPALGESITQAQVSRWLKKVGDPVKVDEPVVSLDTDKVTVDVPSPAGGALTQIAHQEGEMVKVGDVLGVIEASAAAAAPAPAPTPAPKAAEEAEEAEEAGRAVPITPVAKR